MARAVLDQPRFTDEGAAFAHVEALLWPNGPVCPHCGATDEHVYRLGGKATRPGLHKCRACSGQFTVRQGTIFESSHLPLHLWLQVIHLMCASKKGVSTRQIQRMLNCSMKTAWFLTHRIREAMADGSWPTQMGGEGETVEVDEAFLARDGAKKLAGPGPQFPVMALVQRGGSVRSIHVPNITGDRLNDAVREHVSKETRLVTDGARWYRKLSPEFAHQWVAHDQREYVRGDIHTNTVEGYFSILKRGVYGVFHHVSEAHLHRYLSEFDYRYNTRVALGIDDQARAAGVVAKAKGKHLTYATTRRGRTATTRRPSA